MARPRAGQGAGEHGEATLTPALLVVFAPAACAALVVAARRPARSFLFAYAAAVPFGSGITVPVPLQPPFNTLTTLLGLAAGAAVFTEIVLVEDRRTDRAPPMVALAICLLAVAGLTYGWSIDRVETADEVYVLTSLVGLYVVTLLARFDRRDARDLGTAVATGGLLACLYGYWLLFTDALPTEGAGVARFSTAGGVGDDADPNITAATLVLPFAIALHRALVERGRARVAWVFAVVVMGGGILLTASRGGLLGTTVALLVVVFSQPRPQRALAAALITLVAVVALTSVVAPDQLDRLTNSTSGSSGRTSVWQLGMDACADECATGTGLGTYLQVHEETFLNTPDASGVRASLKAHNMWLQLGVEAGVVSVVLLALLFASTVGSLLRTRWPDRAPALAGLAALLVTNLFLANVGFKYFWLVLLYAAVVATSVPPRPRFEGDVGRLLWHRMRPHLPIGAAIGASVAVALAFTGSAPASRERAVQTIVVATRPPDVAEFGLDELVQSVFEAADLDEDADITAREGEIAYVVTGTGRSPEQAARRSVRAATGLVERFNASELSVGGLMVAVPGTADHATTVPAGSSVGLKEAAAAGLVITALVAVLLGIRPTGRADSDTVADAPAGAPV